MKKNQQLFLKKYLTAGLFLLCLITTQAQTNSNLVYMSGGSLVYAPYANQGQLNDVNTIPDFSYAGYKQGGVALPDVAVVKTISPIAGDNTQFIQDAIDYVEALPLNGNGIRGALLLTAGDYTVNGQLYIKASGVVLRGEGQGITGTVLHANKATQHDFLRISNSSATSLQEDGNTTKRITTAYVPVGTHNFSVADASGFSIGDLVSVKKTVNQKWIDDLGTGQTQLCGSKTPPDCVGWKTAEYTLMYERVITNISGNTLTINIPIVDAMETKYGGGEVSKASYSGRLTNCGVENLRIESAYASDTDEEHVWVAIKLVKVENCWVKKVTGQYMGYSAISLSDSNFNTIEECAAIDYKSLIEGGRRYGFNIAGKSLGNLFQRCYTREGRHDFVTASRVTGPNVFLDSYATNTYADIGPHHRWSTGLLFDNIRGGQMRVQNRGDSGTGHGWSGAQTLFWNVKSYKSDIKVESPPGARNWGIGCEGKNNQGNGYWEHWDTNVTPRSLYLQQLQDRLGIQAVDNITIEAQKTGDIYTLLAIWAGEGDLASINPNEPKTEEDAYVSDGINTSNNFGSENKLIVKGASSPDFNRMSFLKFDLGSITESVSSAKIKLKVIDDASGGRPLQNLNMVSDDSWSENTIMWDNKPEIGSLIDTQNVPLLNEWIEFDVTDEVISELGGDGVISVVISGPTNSYITYHSLNATALEDRPKLFVNGEPLLVSQVFKNDLKIYPNPVTDQLSIISSHAIKDVNLFNLEGMRINNFEVFNKGNILNIDLKPLATGLYMIRLEDYLGNITTKKIIKK